MKVYIIEGYYDTILNEVVRQGRILWVSPKRGHELISLGVAIEMDLNIEYF